MYKNCKHVYIKVNNIKNQSSVPYDTKYCLQNLLGQIEQATQDLCYTHFGWLSCFDVQGKYTPVSVRLYCGNWRQQEQQEKINYQK